MQSIEVTSVSSKGQVVIPTRIREELGIVPGTKLIVMSDGDNLLMKPIQPPMVETFEKLVKKSRKLAVEAGLTGKDVKDAIDEARRENRG